MIFIGIVAIITILLLIHFYGKEGQITVRDVIIAVSTGLFWWFIVLVHAFSQINKILHLVQICTNKNSTITKILNKKIF
jgi:hypothetical protein